MKEQQPRPSKNRYTPPLLRSYGNLRAITHGKKANKKEVGGSGAKKTRTGD